MAVKVLALQTGTTSWMQPGIIDKAIEAGLDDLAAEVKVEFESTTESWEHKPLFVTESSKGRRLVYTDDQHYSWVNYGTNRSGDVVPVNKKALNLPSYWTPKSRAGDLFSYSGNREYADNQNLYVRVKKSSIKARRFDLAVYQFFTVTSTKQFFLNALNRLLGSQ